MIQTNCKYHYLVGNPIKKCFIFKDKVTKLAKQERILLEQDKTSVYKTTIGTGSLKPVEVKITIEEIG